MTCNLQTVPFTLFQGIIHWFSNTHRIVHPFPLSHVTTFSSPQTGTSPHQQLVLISSSPQPWQSLISFLSLWIFLFGTLHINEITQYMAFGSGFLDLQGFQGSFMLYQHFIVFFFFYCHKKKKRQDVSSTLLTHLQVCGVSS